MQKMGHLILPKTGHLSVPLTQRPRFALYVGRKSAPLGLPLNPEIIEANTFMEAFEARQPSEEERNILQRLRIAGVATGEIAFDHDALDTPGVPTEVRIERRRDAVLSRTRWQFADRLEAIVMPESGQE